MKRFLTIAGITLLVIFSAFAADTIWTTPTGGIPTDAKQRYRDFPPYLIDKTTWRLLVDIGTNLTVSGSTSTTITNPMALYPSNTLASIGGISSNVNFAASNTLASIGAITAGVNIPPTNNINTNDFAQLIAQLTLAVSNLNVVASNTAMVAKTITTNGQAAGSNNTMVGFLASSNTSTAVAHGSVAAPRIDLYRRLELMGYDATKNALSVSEITPALFQSQYQTNHNAITASATNAAVDVSNYRYHLIQTVTTGAYSGTGYIEGSLDGSNWYSIATNTWSAAGTFANHIEMATRYLRVGIVTTNAGNIVSVFQFDKN